jgi:hypothetical protein
VTQVKCDECGHSWDYSGEDVSNARCSKPECGRSRKVSAVETDDAAADVEDDAAEDLGDEPEPDDDADEGGSTYRASFEAADDKADVSPGNPFTSDGDDADGDGDDGEDSSTSSDAADAAAEEIPDIDAEQIEMGIDATFDYLAARRGPHWALEEQDGEKPGEAEALAKAWTPVVNHYAPILFKQYTELGAAVIVTVSVVGPRLATDRAMAEDAEQADREAREEAQTGTPVEDNPTIAEATEEPTDDLNADESERPAALDKV